MVSKEIREQITDFETKTMINLIKDLIYGIIDLKSKYNEILMREKSAEDETNDYFILYRKTDIRLKQSLYVKC